MKKIIFSGLFIVLIVSQSFACTNLLVGKKASVDGATMLSYNADSYTLYGELYHWPAKKYPKGSMLRIEDWETGKYLGDIKQARETYNVVGNMNEYQLSIAETTFEGRPELDAKEGIIDYGSLIYIALQRCKTAREAIKVMTDLVNQYGYHSSGETFSIADPNEVWMMDLIGKGKGNKGAVWVAVRIPDDCIAAHANQSRIQQFPLNDPKNCLYSKDVISFARQKGYFVGTDASFSFAKAYNPIDFGAQRYCEARVWSFFNRFNKSIGEKYLSYAEGNMTDPMPLYVKVDRKLSVSDVRDMMRDHYEGTPFESIKDISAGPFESPYHYAPLEWKVDSVQYFNERPIATQQTGFTFVAQMRSWLPRQIGGVLWFAVDDAAQAVYTPIYCSMTDIPNCYKVGNGDLCTFSWTSAFWIHSWVSNMVYSKYNYMHPDVVKVQAELENGYMSKQDSIEKVALDLYKSAPSKACEYLNAYSIDQSEHALERWKQLGEYLIMKYMDGVVRKEKDGHLLRNEYGKPAEPNRVGYSKSYYENVARETGGRYKTMYKKK